MSKRLSFLKRYQRARRRLRDIAAANMSQAQSVRQRHRVAYDREVSLRDNMARELVVQLQQVSTAFDLQKVADTSQWARQNTIALKSKLSEADTEIQSLGQLLRGQEHALRVATKLVCNAKAEVRRQNDKAEQRLADELASRRVWRKI